jgi:hypothetical protein
LHKKIYRILIIIILQILILNQLLFLSFPVNGQETEYYEDDPPPTIIQPFRWFGYNIGKAWTIFVPIIQFVTSTGAADPPYIEIGYNETVTIDVGLLDLSSNEFEIVERDLFILTTRYLNFEVVDYPGGNDSASSWFIHFDPNSITYKKGNTMKAKARISLTSPPIAENAIQSGVLTIKAKDYWVYANTWWPDPDHPGYQNILLKISWFLGGFTGGYGKYSGTVNLEPFNINILVKVKPYHAIKFETISLIQLQPNQITSIPIKIENIGNYVDTFNFRIVGDNENVVLANPVSITLSPGEKKETILGIAVEPSVFDLGTLHQIDIEAYSVYEPNFTISTRTILLETKGVFISEVAGLSIGFFGFLIMLVVVFYIYKHRTKIVQELNKTNINDKRINNLNKILPNSNKKLKGFLKKINIKSKNRFNGDNKKLRLGTKDEMGGNDK